MLRRALVLIVAAGCGSDTASDNQAPVWQDAPAALTVGQGQTVSLPLTGSDPDGDAVTVSVSTPAGLEAEITAGPPRQLSVHAGYELTGAVALTVTLADAAGAARTVTVPVTVKQLGWRPAVQWTSAGPTAREHAALIVDPDGSRVLLLGGSGYMPYLAPLDDAWSYDAAAASWSPITPAGAKLGGGGSRRVAQIPGQRVAYLFGGYGAGGANNADLYRVTWTKGGAVTLALLSQNNPPPKRALHAFAYDPTGDRFVLFGGAGQKPLNDTWIMKLAGDAATWAQVQSAGPPSPRYGFFYGVDEARQRLILFSGAQGFNPLDPARDTWALDLAADPPAWQLLAQGDAVPPGRRNGCAAFDPSGPRLVVFGGTPDAMTTAPGLWLFDARPGKSTWTELVRDGAPTPRSSGIGFATAPISAAGLAAGASTAARVHLGFGNTSNAVFQDWAVLGY